MSLPAVLVVAGLDPSGGAGLLADAEAIRAAGARPLVAASALTIQTSRSVRGVHPLPPEVVEDQILALAEEDGPILAVKVGMLGTQALVRTLGLLARREEFADIPWVVDPVLRSSSGSSLLEGGVAALRDLFLPNVLLTPNLHEAGALLGRKPPATEEEMIECGESLLWRGAGAAVVTGGHLEGEAFDVLCTPTKTLRFEGERVQGDRRGTGCRLASFLAGRLAWGDPVEEALFHAKSAVWGYLARGQLPSPPRRA